jgi:hypothetical protein
MANIPRERLKWPAKVEIGMALSLEMMVRIAKRTARTFGPTTVALQWRGQAESVTNRRLSPL